MREYLQVLRRRDFALLWAGQAVSKLGSKISYIALTWLVADLTGKASSVGLLFIILTIPSVVLGPWAGVLIDRWDKKKLIVISDILNGLFALGMVLTDKIWGIYLLAMGMAIVFTFFDPAIRVVIPRLVPEEELITANSLSSSTYYASNLVGPALGGVLIGFFGVKAAFIINGVSFFISALSEMFIRIKANQRELHDYQDNNIWERFREGWDYIKSNQVVLFVILFFAVGALPMGALPILNIVLIKEILKFGPSGYGTLMTIKGVGLFLGTFLMGRWGKGHSELKLMVLGVGLIGLGYLLFALNSFFILSALILFGIGIAGTVVNVSYGTYLQKAVDEEVRGRVFSLDMALGNVVGLISMSLAGFLGDTFGIARVIAIGGGFIALQALVTSRLAIYRQGQKSFKEIKV